MTDDMTGATRAIYQRLLAFEFDTGTPRLPFHRRLAAENGWPEDFAARAITEYRRFLLLAVTAGHAVTPSDEVDQVWHLHLLYTRSYWERLCGDVLGRPLHHEPTQGGTDEKVKFLEWYSRTLESYRRTFGSVAPADLWPPQAVRFSEDVDFKRVDAARTLFIPKFWRPR